MKPCTVVEEMGVCLSMAATKREMELHTLGANPCQLKKEVQVQISRERSRRGALKRDGRDDERTSAACKKGNNDTLTVCLLAIVAGAS